MSVSTVRNRRKNHNFAIIITLMSLVLVVMVGAVLYLWLHGRSDSESGGLINPAELMTEDTTAAQESSENGGDGGRKSLSSATVRLSMVGDVLLHNSVLTAARADTDNNSDFSFIFKHIVDPYRNFDLNIVDMEGTMGPPPFTAYPLFHSPTKLAEDMHKAGVGMAITANNHAIDAGEKGVTDTFNALVKNKIIPVGTSLDAKKKTWCIREINGIKIGFSAYTYETVRQNGRIAINALILPESLYGRLDSFSYEDDHFDDDKAKLAAREKEMREAGAEVTVFFMHWGTEYDSKPTFYQRELAKALAKAGTNLILACGPHVIQPIETLPADNSDGKCLVYYSVGNFVSAQYFDTGDSNGRAEDGLMAMVEFKRDEEGEVKLNRAGYCPLYCYKPVKFGGAASQAVPNAVALADPKLVDGRTSLVEASKIRIDKIMAENNVGKLPFYKFEFGYFDE